MLDEQCRITIRKDVLDRHETIKIYGETNIFYDPVQRSMVLLSKYVEFPEGLYFINKHKIDKKGRLIIPISIRKAFPGATYLPAEKNGRIYILIIEHEKKSE